MCPDTRRHICIGSFTCTTHLMVDYHYQPADNTDFAPDVSNEQKPITRPNETPNPKLSFPPLPTTVAEVTQLIDEIDEEPDTLQLADIVDGDPVVAAAVLRRINSAYYGMRRRIGSVRKAVMLLGFLEVANIVMTAGMVELEEAFAADSQPEIFDEITRINIGVAQLSRELVKHYNHADYNRIYTTGLLHGVGRLVLLYNEPEAYASLWADNEDRTVPSIEQERTRFGTDHASLGAQAADEWKLPSFIANTIRSYSDLDSVEEEHREIATVIAAASCAIRSLAKGTFPEDLKTRTAIHQFAEMVDIDTDEVRRLIEAKHGDIQRYVSTMVGS